MRREEDGDGTLIMGLFRVFLKGDVRNNSLYPTSSTNHQTPVTFYSWLLPSSWQSSNIPW
jgi:hypothetical protein